MENRAKGVDLSTVHAALDSDPSAVVVSPSGQLVQAVALAPCEQWRTKEVGQRWRCMAESAVLDVIKTKTVPCGTHG